MALKKSIVFVGAVLLLAACDRATAPTAPISLHDGPSAAAKAKVGGLPTTTTNSTGDGDAGGCVFVRLGGDSTLVCSEQ